MPSPNGFLIAFEGPEGAGKSTQLGLAASVLRRAGRSTRESFEPGATRLGESIRQLLLHERAAVPIPLAELFLYLADRAQHVAEVIQPALQNGDIVLTDRFSGSTLAYQGFGRELDYALVVQADAWARAGVGPQLTILLDCPVGVGLRRAHGSDRFHAEVEAFHERVRHGFLSLAAQDATWHVVDATEPVATVHERVMAAILACLQRGESA